MSTPPPTGLLTSPQNPYVKALVELRKDGELRRAEQRFLIEGKRAVAAALAQNRTPVLELVYSENVLGSDLDLVEQARAKNIRLVPVTKDVFKKIADTMEPQGIAAVVKLPEWTLAQVLGEKEPLLAVADGLQDPGNLGTLIRSCEAAGAAGLITLEGTADPFNAKVVRSTAAALLTFPIVRMKRAEFIAAAQKNKIQLVATVARDGTPYKKFDWSKRPLALCVGSEGDGLHTDLEKACNARVSIPMRGESESLNAAVAASILLFEALG